MSKFPNKTVATFDWSQPEPKYTYEPRPEWAIGEPDEHMPWVVTIDDTRYVLSHLIHNCDSWVLTRSPISRGRAIMAVFEADTAGYAKLFAERWIVSGNQMGIESIREWLKSHDEKISVDPPQ